MKKVSIHYIDDDEEDLEFFNAAALKVPSVLDVHTYMRSTDFLNAIENVDVSKTIVFLDINMPEKSGLDILKILRSNDKLKSLPIIMYSTSKDQKVIDISKEFGADYYAVKPASYLSIKELINEVCTIDWSISFNAGQNFLLIHLLKMEDFLFRLKTSTAEVHKQLENSTLSKIIMSPAVTTDLYAEYLSSIYNMHKEVEELVFKVVAPVIKDILNRQKTHKIISDLTQLGKGQPLNTKTFLDKAYTTSLNFNLGIMYVTEGSVLGGQYILKNIKHVLGVEVPGNFFNVYGTQTGASWKNFTIQLNDYQDTLNDVGKEEIISGAKYGFERAHSIFN